MIDLDHFQLINDNHGHADGNTVITFLVEMMHSDWRQEDLIGRYGREEFCAVLSNQTMEAAFKVAERIQLSFKDQSIERFEGVHMQRPVFVIIRVISVSQWTLQVAPTCMWTELTAASH